MLTHLRALTAIPVLILAATATTGCVRGPDVSGGGLGLRRVVIYRNGVGYFERQGHVESNQVSFRVRNEKVGDFLASLAVIEQGGSSVRTASFPVDVKKSDEAASTPEAEEEEPAEPNCGMRPCSPPPPKKHKKEAKKDSLETVTLSLDGKEHDLVVGYVAETPVWRPSYRLVVDTSAAPKPGAPGKPDTAPARTAQLQGWGIVQNLSGEDWKGVTLSLVAGAPIAFQSTLEKAVIPPRPVVSDTGEVIASVPVGETTVAEAPPPPPVASPAPAAAAAPETKKSESLNGLLQDMRRRAQDKDEQSRAPGGGLPQRQGSGSGRGRLAAGKPAKAKGINLGDNSPGARSEGYGYQFADSPAAPPPAAPPAEPAQQVSVSPPRNVQALAAVAMTAGSTHYDLPFKVDVPDKSATMVLLLSKNVPGESIFLFSPDGGVPQSSSHPFRVVRFTNDTAGLLERGPIAVYENGAFLGQGMVEPLPPGGTATVPFALERAIGIDSARKDNEEGARIAQIEGGRLEIDRDWVTHTKYTVKNGSDADIKLMVKHARLYDTRLFNPPKGTEDNIGTQAALVPVEVGKGATQVLDVDERRSVRRSVDWLDPLADEAVKAYIKDLRADRPTVIALEAAWEARGKLRVSLDEHSKLNAERDHLSAQVEQINGSMKALEKNQFAGQLRKDLTERLARASTRLDEITKRTVVLDMQVAEQSVRLRDLLTPLKMTKPLPPQ